MTGQMPPNVLLVVFDTARADAFEPYGAGGGASPTMAQLARRGYALPAAYAPSNWTLPSHISMFSGLAPRATGLTQAPGGKAVNARPYVEALRHRLLPEVLRGAGYSTRGVSANVWISKATGFATGFDEFHDVMGARQLNLNKTQLRARLNWMLEGARARADDGASEVEELMRSWIEDAPSQPFFWFVNLIECHSPYLPPKPYNDTNLRARMRAANDVHRYQTLGAVWRACAVREPISPSALGRMRHLYGRSIKQLDDWLARLLERMDRHRLLDDTLVIVTSDHGENLGESNLIGHVFSLDERLIHIPMVISGPGTFQSKEAVSLTALPRLIAKAVGLSGSPWGDEGIVDGVAVSEYDALTSRDDPRVNRTAAEWGLDEEAIGWITSRGTAATDGMLKLVRTRGVDRLHDLRVDPLETNPMDPLGAPAALRSALEAAEGQDAIIKPQKRNSERDTGKDADVENAELEQRLRMLGYL
jgi:arylsulfatase A-like enzyme